jgi:hypothetical protein
MPPDGFADKASVAIDGSKFKAVNSRDKNFTKGKVERRRRQLEESVARYLAQLDTADLQDPSEALAAKTAHLKEKLAKLAIEMRKLDAYETEMLASPDQQISLTDPDCRSIATSGRGSGARCTSVSPGRSGLSHSTTSAERSRRPTPRSGSSV